MQLLYQFFGKAVCLAVVLSSMHCIVVGKEIRKELNGELRSLRGYVAVRNSTNSTLQIQHCLGQLKEIHVFLALN